MYSITSRSLIGKSGFWLLPADGVVVLIYRLIFTKITSYKWNLAIGIGIQNFPEGLAVSLPLQASGFSTWKSLWYGQLSGMVEPIFGVLGALAVSYAQPALPYALAFAAGAMIYVVIDDIIPEANTNGNGKLATWGAVLGFLVMMILDVGLG
ncbi:hypothetical protein WA026_020583 [Henosepilachna vigintioctopunctata]|uniref:Zinc transporter ZIP11 n=1 Tax=Henosepilachna vigintioctopunctata TaxID=420089 RepID=A0AAW1V326_9CUCU